MGRTVTPKYRIESRDNMGKLSQWAWRGKVSASLLADYMDSYNASFQPSGANWHVSKALGVVAYHSAAKVINQRTGEIVATWSAPLFSVA